jgi:hypothetical protein
MYEFPCAQAQSSSAVCSLVQRLEIRRIPVFYSVLQIKYSVSLGLVRAEQALSPQFEDGMLKFDFSWRRFA